MDYLSAARIASLPATVRTMFHCIVSFPSQPNFKHRTGQKMIQTSSSAMFIIRTSSFCPSSFKT